MATTLGDEEFDPAFEWAREEDGAFTTLLIHLPGFRKDHLRLQLDAKGNLRVSGERPLDGQRWRRFVKNFQRPENCNSTDGIRAKFENETLQVRFPITVVQPPPASAPQQSPSQKPTPATTAAMTQKENSTLKGDDKSTGTAGQELTQDKSQAGNGKSTVARKESEKEKEELAGKENTFLRKEKENIEQEGNRIGNGEYFGKRVQPSSSSPPSPGDDGVSRAREEMTKYGVGGILTAGLTPARKVLLVNVAVACLVLLGVGLYFKYK